MSLRDGCKERSVSLGGPTSDVRVQSHVSRTRSCTGGSVRIQRQRSYKRTEDDDKLKKSRAWANAYELSQDLHEKQLEMLERKYGGHLRAKRAARIIQQAFRQYCMNRNFEKLRQGAGERRLSRRLGELGRSATIWSDMVADSSYNVTVRFNQSGYTIDEHGHYHHNGSATTDNLLEINRGNPRGMLQKSKSLNIAAAEQAHIRQQQHLDSLKQKSLQRTMGLDLTSAQQVPSVACKEKPLPVTHVPPPQVAVSATDPKAKPPQTEVSPEETNNNRHSYPEMNDSSASDSPQGTPIEPTVDLPSVNFENLLESKETDILNDSFHSDSSQEGLDQIGEEEEDENGMFRSHNQSFDNLEASDSDHSTLKANSSCTYQDYQMRYSESSSDTVSVNSSDVQLRAEEMEKLGSAASLHDEAAAANHTPGEDSDTLTRVYGNAEVKLRRKKASNNIDSEGEFDSPNPPSSPSKMSPEASPIWKRKSAFGMTASMVEDGKRMSNISEVSEPESVQSGDIRRSVMSSQSSDSASMCSEGSNQMVAGYHTSMPPPKHHSPPRMTDRQRKRMYRIGLNLFNKRPEKGIKYLIERRFVDNSPMAVAKFLISRKGLSKQMIGEFLGNLQKQFNSEALEYFTEEIDLSGLQVDVALRKFQSHFRMPGEAQKIERLVEAFAHRFCMCNPDQVKKHRSPETVFLLSFAIIMLNTDLHNASIKPNKKMKLEDFIRNLRGIDDGEDIDRDLLTGIYERIKAIEFKPGTDHVSQVMKVEQMVTGKKPQLALTYRRLVCYCRLYQVNDPNKREKLGLHQREVFLFNDLLMVTKIFSKKKTITYSFRQSFSLLGMVVYLFETSHYQFGIRLCSNIDNKILITFNARNEHDRTRFVEDLKEAILEINEMEALRIEEELQKQRNNQTHHNFNRHSNDSGMVDIELLKPSDPGVNRLSAPECGLKKTNLSNSLIDLSDGGRRGSGGSLDSGMASTSSGSTGSREEPLHAKGGRKESSSKLGGIFKKSKHQSKTSLKGHTEDASEV